MLPRIVDSTTITDESSRWARLFIICGSLYLLHACYAVFLHRHLYGDASWFLVRMISEGKPTNFYTDFFHQFYYSRVVAYWLTQLPTVIGIKAGIASTNILSYIFGATYFGHRLVSLAICYLLLDREEKRLIAFPLFGLFAGTIVSDVYIVTEIHIAVSFLWPIAILLFRSKSLTGAANWIAVVAILLASFTYESWAIFAVILLTGLLLRGKLSERRLWLPLWPSCALVVCGLINWCAILFPRDPTNKEGFLNGIRRIIYNCAAGTSHWDIGAMAGLLAVGCVLVLMLLSLRLKSSVLQYIALAMACVFALTPPLHLHMTRSSLDLSYAITDRGFAGLIMQAGLLAIFIGVRLFNYNSNGGFRAIACLLLGLAIGQVAWQMMVTHVWGGALRATHATLEKNNGAVACEAIDAQRGHARMPPPSAIMCDSWWITPFSLLQNDRYHIRAIITTRSAFQPFDVYEPLALPGISNGTFKYDAYLTALRSRMGALKDGRVIMFGGGDSGISFLRSGFANPEPGQTWTEGRMAVLHICLPEEAGAATYRFIFTVVPHLDPHHLPLSVEVRPGLGGSVKWEFQRSAIPWVSRSVDVSRADFSGAGCGDIDLDFGRLPASPAELGESKDNRHLGLALIRVQVTAL